MLQQRAVSAAVLVPLVLVGVWLGGLVLVAAVAIIAVIAAIELFRLLRAAGYPSFPLLGAVFALIVVLDAAAPSVIEASGLLLGAVAIILIGVGALTRTDPREGLATWATTVFGALYVAMLAFVVRLADAGPVLSPDAPLAAIGAGRAWVALLILTVWAFDTGAYVVGSRIGRRPFMQHLSPSKTVEGLIGGLVAAAIGAAVLHLGLGLSPVLGIVFGLIVGATAQAGDLAESMLKRAAGVKESGTLIPGHGGMLDRIDSFLFAAPVVMLYVVVAVR
ncbi:MAG: phosphatidate cytidylyltransferase [Chloroflexota bacterium]